jgi:hypothetical protein
MKYIIIMNLLFPVLLIAQGETPKIEYRKIEFSEISENFNTLNEKGEAMILLAALDVKIHSKRCYDKGFRVNLPMDNKKEFEKAGWYMWHVAKNCWVKDEIPQKTTFSLGGSGFTVLVKCPGTYAYFEQKKSSEKGIELETFGDVKIKNVHFIQEFPQVVFHQTFEHPVSEIKIPTSDLQFNGKVILTLTENGVLSKKEFLVGALVDLSEDPKDNGFRFVKLKSDKLQLTLLTNQTK